jgi:hypothetical protein
MDFAIPSTPSAALVSDPRCHHEAYESDPLHCQSTMIGNQSRNTAWLPRYGCSVSMGDALRWIPRKIFTVNPQTLAGIGRGFTRNFVG